MNRLHKHWDKIFSEKHDSQLGWYEKDISQTIKFLDLIKDYDCKTAFLPGAGTSVLVDELISRNMSVILNDISHEALSSLKKRIGKVKNSLTWLCRNIADPLPSEIQAVDIWIDRAVLHFLIEESDINGYFRNLSSTVKTGGYVLLAEFSNDGAKKCAGLTLHRYTIEEMKERLGSEFECIYYENYTYTNPFGEPRPYIYGLFKKVI